MASMSPQSWSLHTVYMRSLLWDKRFKHLDYLYTSAVNEADHPQKTNFKHLEN